MGMREWTLLNSRALHCAFFRSATSGQCIIGIIDLEVVLRNHLLALTSQGGVPNSSADADLALALQLQEVGDSVAGMVSLHSILNTLVMR